MSFNLNILIKNCIDLTLFMSFLSLGLFLKSSKPNLVFNISLPYPVSVLIPIYNKIGYLQRSYGSLQNQTISFRNYCY